jgi:hypothetical protein
MLRTQRGFPYTLSQSSRLLWVITPTDAGQSLPRSDDLASLCRHAGVTWSIHTLIALVECPRSEPDEWCEFSYLGP